MCMCVDVCVKMNVCGWIGGWDRIGNVNVQEERERGQRCKHVQLKKNVNN